MTRILALTLTATLVVSGTLAAAEKEKEVPDALKFKMKNLAGKEVALSDYLGKVVLVVNVASKCGLTPQYEQLQALHEKYAERGLVVIGVPANNFGGQEPGTNLEIRQFCTTNYGVTFPMMAKVSVKGDDQAPLYAAITSEEYCPADPGPVKWNFEKFLIGRDGTLASRFRSGVKPQSAEVVAAVEAALGKAD